ncbi:MAG TPA: hypothetical protein PK950_02905 [Candidatus Paceibacterota bacterium]|nr:hypothetical protein [Candidatus Paceibacterota bacterium]
MNTENAYDYVIFKRYTNGRSQYCITDPRGKFLAEDQTIQDAAYIFAKRAYIDSKAIHLEFLEKRDITVNAEKPVMVFVRVPLNPKELNDFEFGIRSAFEKGFVR